MSTPPPHPSQSTTAPAPAGVPSLVSAGGWPFLITGLIGRLPAATVQLGVLLYVSGAGLGLGLAGLTVAATGLGSAVGAPLLGRMVDRFGPLPVVVSATAVQLLGMGSLLAVVLLGHPPPWSWWPGPSSAPRIRRSAPSRGRAGRRSRGVVVRRGW